MRFRPARPDRNQPAIVRGLRDCGCTVHDLSLVGNGCPDLLVGWRGRNVLLEVKRPDLDAAHTALTKAEAAWHASWRGQVTVVRTLDEALAAVGVLSSPPADAEPAPAA